MIYPTLSLVARATLPSCLDLLPEHKRWSFKDIAISQDYHHSKLHISIDKLMKNYLVKCNLNLFYFSFFYFTNTLRKEIILLKNNHHHCHQLWRVRHSACSLALKVTLVLPSFPRASYISPPCKFKLHCLFGYPVFVHSL